MPIDDRRQSTEPFLPLPVTDDSASPHFLDSLDDNMGNSLSVSYETARWLAPLSFVVDFAVRVY